MPHQNVHSSKATAQNAAVPSSPPNDQAREQNRSVRPEPGAYAAPDHKDASLAPPAAGEVADYMDEGDALNADGAQQGSTRAARPIRTEAKRGQGARTRAANQAMTRSGSPDQGTH